MSSLVEISAESFRSGLESMYFPVRALQVDGGSEFAADFEQACRHRHLRLFALPPHSPKLNGTVERAPRTYTEEFYEVTPCSCQVTPLSQEPPRPELI
jgi:hypothetical protein